MRHYHWIEIEVSHHVTCRVSADPAMTVSVDGSQKSALQKTLYEFFFRCKHVPVDGIVFRYQPDAPLRFSALRSAWVIVQGVALLRGVPCNAVAHQGVLDEHVVRDIINSPLPMGGLLYASTPTVAQIL